TLSRTVDVTGELKPVNERPISTTGAPDGFDGSVEGARIAWSSGALSLTVSQNGAPAATMEPYLGAYEHLVAPRAGDMRHPHDHLRGGGCHGRPLLPLPGLPDRRPGAHCAVRRRGGARHRRRERRRPPGPALPQSGRVVRHHRPERTCSEYRSTTAHRGYRH